jgi:hypothetical protein
LLRSCWKVFLNILWGMRLRSVTLNRSRSIECQSGFLTAC